MPKDAVQGAVLDRFADMFGENVFGVGEVGDGAGDFEDAIVGACAEVEFRHRHFHHAFGGFVQGAMVFQELCGHAGIAAGLAAFSEALALDFAGGGDAFTDRGGGFAGSFGGEDAKGVCDRT